MGPTATTIPFSMSKYGAPLSTDDCGDPLLIGISGFGTAEEPGLFLKKGEWDTGTITITDQMYCGNTFIMPHDAKLKSIYAMFTTVHPVEFENCAEITPFVCLAVSKCDDLKYTILQDTITCMAPYRGGACIPTHTSVRGRLKDLCVDIPEGTLVAIVVGVMGKHVHAEQFAAFTISGGLYLE